MPISWSAFLVGIVAAVEQMMGEMAEWRSLEMGICL